MPFTTTLLDSRKSKFNTDLLWNMASFGLSGVIGILLNIIIVKKYDTETLGVFNQIYAIYILLSQVAVGGVHLSVQLFIPKHIHEQAESNRILSASLLVSTLTSFAVMGLAFFLADVPGKILNSTGVEKGFYYVIGGLLFFSLNKILLAYHNGFRRMKAFAFFQALRFILMLIALLIFINLQINPYFIAAILAIAEVGLFILLFCYSLQYFHFHFGPGFWEWVKRHFIYGNKALLGNILLDVNTRVDIFLLGIFLSDAVVGIYSFAATIAEGVFQLPVLFRNNINPIITKCHTRKGNAVLTRLIRKNTRAFYKVLSSLTLLSIVLFPIFLWLFHFKEDFYTIWIIYAILVGGLVLTSGYMPFQMLFNQIGLPLTQTLFISLIFLCNVLLNLAFIPLLGIYGAALATACSMLVQVFIQKYLFYRYCRGMI